MDKRTSLMGACIIALALAGSAHGQTTTATGYGTTAPVLALPGATVSVCAFNWQTGPIASGPVTVTLQIVDVALGASVAQRSVTLPIGPFDPYSPSPCVQLKVSSTATSPAGPGNS